MRPPKVSDIDILSGLSEVFRSKGYEGASLSELSEATGLKKASLYHRYPNGKEEMAAAVLSHLDGWVKDNVFHALSNTDHTPMERLKNGLSAIGTLYDNGAKTCIFRALSMQSSLELFEDQIQHGMKEWVSVFSELGIVLQLAPDRAEEMALQVLIDIQGSLVVSKGLGDISIFRTVLKNIEQRYSIK